MHLGQFMAMAILLAGLLALFFALDLRAGSAKWAGQFGVAAAVTTLALYGALQAVDGVANKQADVAWVSASDPEKVARFASAEAKALRRTLSLSHRSNDISSGYASHRASLMGVRFAFAL